MTERFDAAIVGAGIIGLAHAYHLAKRGLRVIVFERNTQAIGASIRNFGMLWPIGQPAGAAYRLACRSREIWLEILQESGLWHERTGSLHLAYRADEAQVLREFAASAADSGFECALLSPGEVTARTAAVRLEGLQIGLWSPTEVCVDPRQVVHALPGFLERAYGVRFEFQCAVTGYTQPQALAGGREWLADRLFVCAGDDFQTLYPEAFRVSGQSRCKLQMMRSEPQGDGWRLGPMLAAGLTLRHYKSFEACPTLPELRKRVAEETPDYDRFGIHVMASQNGRGEIVIGDSHEYNDPPTPFDNPAIDRLVLDYLRTFLKAPDLRIASRWHGIYAKHPTLSTLMLTPAPGVTIATGVGGAGMTLSFGFAEQVTQSQI